MAALYRGADAVVAYGPHVAAFARARGARNVHVAPQAVDNAFWGAPLSPERTASFLAAFLGRPSRAKGATVLLDAWRESGLDASAAALVLVGAGTGPPRLPTGGAVVFVGPQPPDQVRNFLAAADVCVIPSLRTRGFREPWGLVANEAMNQSTPVIASEEVGAVAGGPRPPRAQRPRRARGRRVRAGRRAAPPARRPRPARRARRQRAPRRRRLHVRGLGRRLPGRAGLGAISAVLATVTPAMRRTVLLTLLVLLAVVVAPAPALGSGLDVIRDCTDDEVMSKTYTPEGVPRRAAPVRRRRRPVRQLPRRHPPRPGRRGGGQEEVGWRRHRQRRRGGPGRRGARRRDPGGGAGAIGSAPAAEQLSQATPAERQAVDDARTATPGPVALDEGAVDTTNIGTAPGVSQAADLPTPLVLMLALLLAGALAVGGLRVRRLVNARRP